ncbi:MULTISPECIES: nucleoside hydrolase [unclassified Shewanella]|uniref:nucleoside hydrolase n=1 Tax=unclassified Shewanella TaxID=196818 RepID=UPI001BC301B5|nr:MULTISPECIES: nucleoside hydrolase [unclassified Shewanella]GIU17519.1 nucleoside hydrolase [Shewanella sp. MBTL60-112-B1]GIU36581.1 nucleoside hydrolase [Shewanella sp. MBTL60-112-B2]
MISKIILDSDPGIDDAMAILFAEAHPAIDLKAITTVYGNATIENGTRNALFLKQKYGFNADIAQGADKPIVRDPVGPTVVVHGETGFGDVHAPTDLAVTADPRPAYQYIIDSVKAEPGEITLVAVGPLTNLALALEAAPEIAGLVKEVVVMGGAFGMNDHRGNVTPYAEANIHDDPHAADMVFTAPWPVVVIGLDVTEESFFSKEYLDQLRDDAAEVGQFIWDISRYYLKFYSEKVGLEGCHVHDPSAIAYVIDPSLFTLREGAIRVVTDGPAEGLTIQKFDERKYQHDDWGNKPVQKVGVGVRDKALLKLYRETIIEYGHRK